MVNQINLENIFHAHGYTDFRWINPKDIVVAQWVRMKCTFGCSSYGKKGCCPPQVPSVAECREFFRDYAHAVIFHFEKNVDRPEDRVPWSRQVNSKLLELERAVFLAGFRKAFLMFMDECRLCADCPGTRAECKNKKQARPGPESLAVDVFATVEAAGYPIQVLKDYDATMNRYAILLVE